ncbi:MAG: hypothetical protein ACXWV7_06130 [Nitrospira sp.]
MADDETPHLHGFQQALAEQGIELSREDYYGTYLGMDERTCTAALLRAKTGARDPFLHAGIIERKAMLFRAHTALHKPMLFPWGDRIHSTSGGTLSAAIAAGGSKFFPRWKQARLRRPSN